MDRVHALLLESLFTLDKSQIKELLQQQTALILLENPEFKPKVRFSGERKETLIRDLTDILCQRLAQDLCVYRK